MIPKPRPRALERADKVKARDKTDRAENAKVKARSGGRCEAAHAFNMWLGGKIERWSGICGRRAAEIHHLKGGIGRRNRGDSIKARWKLHVCSACHREITQHVLVPVDPQADASRIVYERRR